MGLIQNMRDKLSGYGSNNKEQAATKPIIAKPVPVMTMQDKALADNAAENAAIRVEGRIISGTINFKLSPPDTWNKLGDTDMAHDIGLGLVRNMVCMLKMAAEKEGFTVDISYQQVVY